MALTLTQKTLHDGSGNPFQGQFATDGTNLWAISVLADGNGALIPGQGNSITAIASTPVPVVKSSALESNHVFKGSSGNLLDAYCVATTVSGFFMLFDATLAPADGAVTPVGIAPVGAGMSVSFSYPAGAPLQFFTGLVGVFSTTGPFTKTASATAFLSARIQ